MSNVRPVSREDSVSSLNQSYTCEEEKDVQIFAKQMLQGRLFVGKFQEKRYVDNLHAYRDVISISAEETELLRDLEVVRQRVRRFYRTNHWIGITSPDIVGAPAGHCVWVELPDEIFGNYWYKISKIKFRPNETLLRIKIIRPVTATAAESFSNVKNKSSSSVPQTNDDEGNTDPLSFESLHNSFAAARDITLNYISSFITNVATIHNTTEAIKFMSVLLAALVTGLIQLMQYLCDFTIKFMREASIFIKATTPIIIALINLIGKIIGGFYLLILSMWRERKGPPPVYQSPYVRRNVPMVTNSGDGGYGYNTVYFQRTLPVPPRRYGSGVKITPLD